MKKIWIFFLTGVVFFLALKIFAQPEENIPEFKIMTDKPTYTVGEPINLMVTLKNNGQKPIQMYPADYPGAIKIMVIDGESIQMNPQRIKIDARDTGLVTIAPGETKTYTFPNLSWMDAKEGWGFSDLPSQNYTIAVTLTSPPDGSSKNKEAKNIWQGNLLSNRLKIPIFEPGKDKLTGSYAPKNLSREQSTK